MVTVNVACCASCRVQFELDPKPFQSAISVAPRDTRAAVDVPKPSKFADRSKPKADPMLVPPARLLIDTNPIDSPGGVP